MYILNYTHSGGIREGGIREVNHSFSFQNNLKYRYLLKNTALKIYWRSNTLFIVYIYIRFVTLISKINMYFVQFKRSHMKTLIINSNFKRSPENIPWWNARTKYQNFISNSFAIFYSLQRFFNATSSSEKAQIENWIEKPG